MEAGDEFIQQPFKATSPKIKFDLDDLPVTGLAHIIQKRIIWDTYRGQCANKWLYSLFGGMIIIIAAVDVDTKALPSTSPRIRTRRPEDDPAREDRYHWCSTEVAR